MPHPIQLDLSSEEAEALCQFTDRIGHKDIAALVDSESATYAVKTALFEIQQAIWQGAEDATRD